MMAQSSMMPGGPGDRIRSALDLLDEIDHHRHLHRGAAIAAFFVAAMVGVWGFFVLHDLPLWGEVSEFVAAAIVAISWIMIFPIWIFSFMLIMWALGQMGLEDLQAMARRRLLRLGLAEDDLGALRRRVDAAHFRHANQFKSAIRDLIAGHRL